MPELLDLFASRAVGEGCDVIRVGDADAARTAVRDLVAGEPVLVDDVPLLAGLDLGPAPDDPWDARVGVGQARWAAAESGTLVCLQQAGSPRRTSLLPAHHVVVLRAEDVLPTYADLYTALGALQPAPTGVQLITGPSRSGDIESAMIHGMHGPARVSVVLVDAAS